MFAENARLCLLVRAESLSVVFARLNEENLASIQRLAGIVNGLELRRYQDRLLIASTGYDVGNGHTRLKSMRMPARGWMRPRALLTHDRIDDACRACVERESCHEMIGGPMGVLRDIGDTVTWLKARKFPITESVVDGIRDSCLAYDFGDESGSPMGEVTPARLRSVGFEPITSIPAAMEVGLSDGDREVVLSLVRAGVQLGDLDAVHAHIDKNFALTADWTSQNRYRGRHQMNLDRLSLDVDNVTANLGMHKIKLAHRLRVLTNREQFKSRECVNCVYDCEPRWDLKPDPCHATEAGIRYASGWNGSRSQLLNLGMWTLSGKHLIVKNPASGRQVEAIGYGPGQPGTFMVRGVHPPFKHTFEVTLDSYLEAAGLPDMSEDEVIARVGTSDQEVLQLTHWALERMHKAFIKSGTAKFHVDDRGYDNHVLYMQLARDGRNIRVGSDTQASDHGGRQYLGTRIRPNERPRFSTYYHYPYFLDMQKTLGLTPGGRGM
jgi:hypothetical protein